MSGNNKPYDLRKNGIKVRVDEKGNKFEDWPQLPHNIRLEVEQYLDKAGWNAYAGDTTPDIRVLINNVWQNIRLPNEMADKIVSAYKAIEQAKQVETNLQAKIEMMGAEMTRLLEIISSKQTKIEELESQLAGKQVKTLDEAGLFFENFFDDDDSKPIRQDWLDDLEDSAPELPAAITPPNGTTAVSRRHIAPQRESIPGEDDVVDEEDLMLPWFLYGVAGGAVILIAIFLIVFSVQYPIAALLTAVVGVVISVALWRQKGGESAEDDPFFSMRGMRIALSNLLDPGE